MRYAIATAVRKKDDPYKALIINAFVIEASSKYEAYGKGAAIARKLYTANDYYDHFVVVNDGELIITPENAVIRKEK